MEQSALLEQRKFVVPEFVFGPGCVERAGDYCRNFKARRVFLVTDPGMLQTPWPERVSENLRLAGCEVVVFSDVTANPRADAVMAGASLYTENRCDVIVALGGGSPMDCAKGIGIAHTNGQHVLEFEGVDQVGQPGPPIVCIPTTAGTGAEVSQFAIITDQDRKVKIAIVSKTMAPDAALIDPVLTTTMDGYLTACTGLDALTHAVEAYVSNANSMTTDLLALDAVSLIFANLPAAVQEPDNLSVRSRMMLASLHAGMAFSNAILGAVHAMAHSLGGYLDLAHGECNAILLPHVMEYNWEACSERYERLGAAMGADVASVSPGERKDLVLGTLRSFMKSVGVIRTLGELGVSRETAAKLAAMAVNDPCLLTNPRQADETALEDIYVRAL